MMRTTMNLPDDLLAELKKAAAESHRTVTAVVEDALRETLTRRKRRRHARSAEIPTFGKLGLHPGIDLDDSAALLDLMETRDASHRR